MNEHAYGTDAAWPGLGAIYEWASVPKPIGYSVKPNPRWRWWSFWRPRVLLEAIYAPVDCSGLVKHVNLRKEARHG